MKNCLTILLLVFCKMAFAQILPGSDYQFHPLRDQMKVDDSLFMSIPGDHYNQTYLRLRWEADPSSSYLKGSVVTYFTAVQPCDTICLNLHDSLTVDSVVFHQQSIAFARQAGYVLAMPLPSVIPVGTSDSITVYYKGYPPAYLGGKAYNKGLHNGIPVMWTLSEPYGSFTWWPCKMGLTDKADSVEITIVNPDAYKAACIGMLVSETTAGGFTTSVWKHKYPVTPYLIGIAVTNFAVYSDYAETPYGTTQILNYVYPEMLEVQKAQTAGQIPVFQLFTDLFGPYPFLNERYGQTQCGMGGGMEHQTMTFAGNFNHHLLSHELAHMWFGDKITTGSWIDIWLNEGFATYCTGLTYERMFNGFYWKKWKRETVGAICEFPDGSVIVDDTTQPNRIFSARLSYHKPAIMLHMLRWIMGDSVFFQAVRNYIADPGLSYGFARTPDLIGHFESLSGMDLTGFLADWLYGEGYPSYQLSWKHDGDVTVRLQLYQTQSDPSVSFFELPVPVQLLGAGRDTIVVLNHTFSGQEFVVNAGFEVDSVVFDPDIHLISAGNVVSGIPVILKSQINIYPNPCGNMLSVGGNLNRCIQLRVIDISGRTVLKAGCNTEIDVAVLKPGLYFLQIETSEGVSVVRFVKSEK